MEKVCVRLCGPSLSLKEVRQEKGESYYAQPLHAANLQREPASLGGKSKDRANLPSEGEAAFDGGKGFVTSACTTANSPFSTPPAPAEPLSPLSAVVRPNAETRRTTSCTKPPHPAPSYPTPPPPLSSETTPPRPPPPAALAPAARPLAPLPNLLYVPSRIPLHPPLPPPPLSPASIAPLVSTSTTPAISWLSRPLSPVLMKPVKHFCWVLLGYLPYLHSFGWGKDTSQRKWY